MKIENKLTKENLAYLAGFIDGDGCISGQLIKNNDYKFKFKIQLSIVILQKKSRRWFIDHLHNLLLNIGYIRLRNDNMLELTIRSVNDIKSLLTEIRPYLIVKKAQADLVLEIIDLQKNIKTNHEFLEVCKKLDKFMILNDSKKRINTSESVQKALFPPVET
jgi:hypothetical protein